MKDVISILQSRIAKRENTLILFEQSRNHNHFYWHVVEQQKQDKRIIAEIVQLRRVARNFSKASLQVKGI